MTLHAPTEAPEDERKPLAQPFLKWAGGKWAIARRLAPLLPHDVQMRASGALVPIGFQFCGSCGAGVAGEERAS